jgi:hypothetical protein
MEDSTKFYFEVSKDLIYDFKGKLPVGFKTQQELWKHIKYHSNIESFELEEFNFEVDYNGWGKVTIEERRNDPLDDEIEMEFE